LATGRAIYRKQIQPVIVHGADVMDWIFPGETEQGVSTASTGCASD
jgi:hypothetical protein